MKLHPLRIAFLTLWLMTAYAMVPFAIIENTGNYTIALIVVIGISIFLAVILDIKIKDDDAVYTEGEQK